MKLVLLGCCLTENFVAAPRLVVLLLSLLTEHVADVIPVLLLEFVCVHLLGELFLPKRVGFVHGKPEALDEETQLQAPEMLQMMFVAEGCDQGLHARGEGLSGIEVQVRQAYLISVIRGLSLIQVEVDGTMIGQTDKHGIQSLVFHELREVFKRFIQLLRNVCSEMCYCNLLKLDDGHKGNTCMDKDCSSSYQRDRLLEGHLDEIMRVNCK
jgi:hypothetical protein